MSARKLDPERLSTDELIEEIRYTLIRVRFSSHAGFLVPRFEGLLARAKAVRAAEEELLEQIFQAEVAVGWRDESIDDFVRALAALILKITEGSRREGLYQQYFGRQSPSELARPVLGRELATVRTWVDSLKASPEAELRERGVELERLVTLADEAVAAQDERRQRLVEFRSTGARAQIFEQANGERKAAYGELAKLPHTGEGQRLPEDFADRFFRQLRRRTTDVEDVAAARAAAERARQALAEAEARLRAAEAEAQAEAEAKAARAAELEQLAAAEQAAREAARRVAELREKVGRR